MANRGGNDQSHRGQGRGEKPTPGIIGGAALVGATVGVVLSGPLLAVGLGATAAGLCLRDDQHDDAKAVARRKRYRRFYSMHYRGDDETTCVFETGDVARSTGRAGLAVVEKGKEVNEQYGITEKIKDTAQTTYQKAKEVDAEHGVVDKSKAGASRAWGRVREIDNEHRLTARAGAAFGNAMDGIAGAMTAKKDDSAGGSQSSKK